MFGYKEGITKEAQKTGLSRQAPQQAEDGVEFDERKFGLGQGLRPQLINFVRSERILIKDVKLINSPFWVIHPLLCKDITVDGVTVCNEGPNGDGCDPEACENVLIQNCLFHTGDDCIAIKSGRNNDGQSLEPTIQKHHHPQLQMEDGHGGVVIGSEISGGCENVYAENCVDGLTASGTHSPHQDQQLSRRLIQNINMRKVTVGQCKEAVVKINLDYEPKEICYRGFEPTVRNVSMEDVTCQKSNYGVLIIGRNKVENVCDIHVKNCKFDGVIKSLPRLPARQET